MVAGCAIAYAEATGKGAAEVLYSGQSAIGPLLAGHAGYSVGALGLLVACKGPAYCASLSAFRGGPVFPAMFSGAAGARPSPTWRGCRSPPRSRRGSVPCASRCCGCR